MCLRHLKAVLVSAKEAELGALFLVAKEAMVLPVALHALIHKQPPIPLYCGNVTVGSFKS